MRMAVCGLLLVFTASLHAETGRGEHLAAPQPPYTVENLRAWHRSLAPWPWAFSPEEEISLNNLGGAQRLLCFGGGARSGEFMLFTRRTEGWVPIGEINQAHLPIRLLPTTVSGWHDFETFLPLWGSGGKEVLVLHYRWSGNSYQELSRSQGMWCDYEPFKTDPHFCQ